MPGYVHSAIVARAERLRDDRGQPTEQRDWPNATEHRIDHIHIQPAGSSQQWGGNVRQVTTRWRLLSRQGGGDIDLDTADHLTWNGRSLSVVAEPMRWPRPTGGVCHVEAELESAPPVPGSGGATSSGQARDGAVSAAFGQGWTP